MNDDQYFLANAYLDGELTGDDLRIAEADPDVMSEVDRLRSVQSLMRNDGPPSEAVRSAAIAAAMVEFGTTAGASGPVASAGPVTTPVTGTVGGAVRPIHRRRPSYNRYLSIAAAIVAVGAAGLVIANGLGDSDMDSAGEDLASTETFAQSDSDLERSASATTAADAGNATLAAEAPPAVTEQAPASAAEESAADSVGAADSATTLAAADTTDNDTAAADMTESTMSEGTNVSEYATSGGPIEPVADRNVTITTPGQLAGLGKLLADLRDDTGTAGATPETSCDLDDPSVEIIATTRYRFLEGTRTVLVALVDDGIDGHTLAIDPVNCEVLVVGP